VVLLDRVINRSLCLRVSMVE